MNAVACKFEDGSIWWRGSNPTFTYMSRGDAVRLRTEFSATADWFKPTADEFVRQIDAAIRQYDAHTMEQAA